MIRWIVFFIPCWLFAGLTESYTPGGLALIDIPGKKPQKITAFGHPAAFIHKDADHYQALIGIPLDYKKKQASITVEYSDQTLTKTLAVLPKEYPAQHIKLKTNKHVSLSQKNLDRHYQEKKEINRTLENFHSTEPKVSFIWPVTGRISSVYGLRRFYNDQPRKPHTGLDIAVPHGTPIQAPEEGKVIGTGNYFFNGKTVFLEHGSGLITMYCHMDKIDVKQGDTIRQGQIIGKVGTTGRSTGAHLHFGVMLNHTWIDPELLLPDPPSDRSS